MFNVITTITCNFPGTICCFAISKRSNNRRLIEKVAQQLTHTSYLDDRASRIVAHAMGVVEMRHV